MSEQIVHGVNGFLAPSGDAETLAERLLWLLTHPEEAGAMGRRAREFARGFFSIDSYVQFYSSMFREAQKLLDEGSSK